MKNGHPHATSPMLHLPFFFFFKNRVTFWWNSLEIVSSTVTCSIILTAIKAIRNASNQDNLCQYVIKPLLIALNLRKISNNT